MKSPKESFKSLKDTFTLSNGVQIPCVGFGTYLTPDGETAVSSVIEAVHAGYRHIDTAAVYGNEKSVGKAICKCGTDRKELFITSKVWNSAQGYETTLHAFDKTLSDLELDYLDLYLIHWPIPRKHDDDWQQLNRETWRAMEKLYREGRVRAIGVSNFKPRHLDALLEKADIAPMVDQIELHPGMPQDETVEYCRARDILVEAWGPLAQGRLFESVELDVLAAKHRKSVSQIVLRWHLQRGILPLPKSITPSRIVENAQLFDFELSSQEMNFITHIKCESSGLDPDTFGCNPVAPGAPVCGYRIAGVRIRFFTVRPVLLPRHPAGKTIR